MTDAAVEFIRELERADEEVARVLAELDELARTANEVRVRAVALEAFFLRLPAQRERADAAVADLAREVESRADALERARRELATAEGGRDAERLAAARRLEVRTRDALRTAQRRYDGALAEKERLEAEADERGREVPQVEARAREIATLLRGRPRLAEQAGAEPRPGLAGVAAWAGNARAALFVARGALASERDAVIRQANELGALVLGEPLTASSASLVARRVEQARAAGKAEI